MTTPPTVPPTMRIVLVLELVVAWTKVEEVDVVGEPAEVAGIHCHLAELLAVLCLGSVVCRQCGVLGVGGVLW
jgi:hypothetical protein